MSTKHYITYARYERDRGIGEYKNPDVKPPPQWVLDREADLKLSGGFVTKRRNLCPVCHQYRSVNGSCGCDE
jgi:hypothetical protein